MKRIIYELYDETGKVMETLSKKKAMEWKVKGEMKKLRSGHKSKWVRTRTVYVR